MTVTRHVLSDEPVPAFETRPGTVAEPLTDCEEVWRALVLGLRDFIDKNGMPSVVLGLSGGIDSAVVAALAVDALGADRVHGVGLPSKYSSEHSLSDAEDLAKRDRACTTPSSRSRRWSTPTTASVELSGVAAENLQARVRGTLLMGLSNQHGHLLLTTGNKSEVAVGYSTLYGDSAGGFAPDQGRAEDAGLGARPLAQRARPRARRDRADPAELASTSRRRPSSPPGQQDPDSLPSYEELDAVVADYVDRDLGMAELLERGHDPEVVARVLRLVDAAEFKRRQSAPGTKISLKAFGRDRRLPITNRWRETPAQRPRRSGNGMTNPPAESVVYGGQSHRPRARAPPAAGQGARREVGDAHRLRHLQRRGLRGGRHPGAARRRLGGQRRPRATSSTVPVTVDDILLMTKAVDPLDEARAHRRRHALRQLRVRARRRPWPPPSGS